MANTTPKLLNIKQAATFIGVNPGTIRRWALANTLKGIKVGSRGDWRFTKVELLKLTKSNHDNLLSRKQEAGSRKQEAGSRKSIARSMKVKRQSKQEKTFPIVGIGASAGGFEAFSRLLQTLPADTGMAFVFVQHLAPAHPSALSELLSKKTKIRVQEVQDKMRVLQNNIYVIPPNTDLAVTDGLLKLTPRDKSERVYHPIDYFFNTLARTYHSNAIGILLSGTATDGTLGLKAIKAEGGITMAQDETAKYQDMPRNAIDAGFVDFILSPEGAARELSRISEYPYIKIIAKEEIIPKGKALKKILYLLQKNFGVDFTYYKQMTIRRRVMRRMMLAGFKKLEDYSRFLRGNTEEVSALYQDLLINVTSFFRDEALFKALTQKLIPAMLKKRKPNDPMRIWVAGCATGEEAYSIAIILLEYEGAGKSAAPIQIFATDINAQAIEQARTGIYSKTALTNISPQRLSRFFTKIDGTYQIAKFVRDMCVFAQHDFTKDPPFSRLDLVSCQNVLIYLEPILQRKALSAFHYGLKKDGRLMLGKSESVGDSRELFAQTDKGYKIYSKKGTRSHIRLDFTQKTLQDIPGALKAAVLEPSGTTQENVLEKEADTLLLSRYVPASVIINSDLEIRQFRGETSTYLQPSSGRASFNLLKMVRDELSFELQAIIYQAKKEKRSIQKEGVRIKVNGAMHTIGLEAVPMKTQAPQVHFLILFKDSAPSTAGSSEITSPKIKRDAKDERIAKLEQEQIQTREQMKSMHEEYEAANEELQSANEEVLSGNEELQSLNEELETSKEELQSTNEELTTINDELQNRNIELKETRDYAEAIVTTAREPLIVLNKDLRVRTANNAFYTTFQVKPEETEGRLLYDLGNRQWDIPKLRALLEKILPQKNTIDGYIVEHNFETIGHKPMLLNARTLLQEGGSTPLILLAFEDITGQKKGEEALKKALEHRDKFIGIASHELKTPVTSVKVYAQILQNRFRKAHDIKSVELIGKMDAQIDKLTNLISDLLDVTKIEAGRLEFHENYLDFNELVLEIVEELQRTTERHHIVTELSSSKTVYGDRDRIGQVITNFITNAIKYSPNAGKIIIKTVVEKENITLSVQDFGVGISEKDQAKIFDHFYRAGGSGQDTYPGLGLGLYIASEIIIRQKGKIWVKSKKGKGSTFYFSLPIQKKITQPIRQAQGKQKNTLK